MDQKKTREDYNLMILQEISKYVTTNPDQRFIQCLQNLGLLIPIQLNLKADNFETFHINEFYMESEVLYTRLKAKLETIKNEKPNS